MNTPGFNPEVYGTTGWAKVGIPMVAGHNTGAIGKSRTFLDQYIESVKFGCTSPAPQYIGAFNALIVQLNATAELLLDGKGVI